MEMKRDLKAHATLVDRMAQTVGVDLEEAVLDGSVRFDEVADAVLRCTECSDPAHCAKWLDEDKPRQTPPGYCRNTDLFAKLIPEIGS